MKLHTSLDPLEVDRALRRAQIAHRITPDIKMVVFTPGRSLTHRHGYEIQLGTYDKHSLPPGTVDQHGKAMRVRRYKGCVSADPAWSATWHEWGWFIAEIFAADPGARWGSDPARSRHPQGYFSPADFHAKTGGQFRDDPAAKLRAGYDAAREHYGDSYARYLIRHDRELAARGRTPRPWPLSVLGNDGD